MVMEEQLVELSHNNNDANHVVKGKRTKRQRPLSPCAVAATAVTSSCSSATSGAGDHGSTFSSPTTTFDKTRNEEEDMANCLILLAGGKREGNDARNNKNMTIAPTTNTTITATATTITTTTTKIGFYDYECKTCNKTFSSFQALGGHMASHKKPKMTLEEKKLPPSLSSSGIFKIKEANQTHIKSSPQIPTSLQLGCPNNKTFDGNKSKFHECSICGAEFTSGQALGGHMRRHRTSTNSRTNTSTKTSFDATSTTIEVKPRNVLEFDLNLPAPDEDISDSNFQFTTTSKSMVLPAMVGCRY
ncbi:hypothetical protein TanjilG_04321 [Lupinus angustifolius]|uniref:C2H2-type domain-containing protein n=2 Tax=Lupinus angustifolius TaxID=3871 RepID=A0A4P1RPS8_LUPAN|nr:hypothetical protein TanjilG_04321 [Lupinus angustifolius]